MESVSTPLESRFDHVTCFDQWGIRKHDESRDVRTAFALGLFSLDTPGNPENPVI